jgi:hypothetical protein
MSLRDLADAQRAAAGARCARHGVPSVIEMGRSLRARRPRGMTLRACARQAAAGWNASR